MPDSSVNFRDLSTCEPTKEWLDHFKESPEDHLRALDHWLLLSSEALTDLYERVSLRSWDVETAHKSDPAEIQSLRFTPVKKLIGLTTTLVAWVDVFLVGLDCDPLVYFGDQMRAWQYPATYGPASSLDHMENTLAAAVRLIDRIRYVRSYQSAAESKPGPNRIEGPFGLWVSPNYDSVGRDGYDKVLSLAGSTVSRAAFRAFFEAGGAEVPLDFFRDETKYQGEYSARNRVWTELRAKLSPLDVTIGSRRLVDLKVTKTERIASQEIIFSREITASAKSVETRTGVHE